MKYSAAPVIDLEADEGGPARNALEVLYQSRYLVGAVTAVFLLAGLTYAVLAEPVYQSDILIQVEENQGSSKNALTDLSSMFAVKTAASAEIEVLRSRAVIARAVDSTRLYLSAEPRYFPVVGKWIARHVNGLLFSGLGGFAWGSESIDVASVDVPEALEGLPFTLTELGDGAFRLTEETHGINLDGRVGQPLNAHVAGGDLALLVKELVGAPGVRFTVIKNSRLATIQRLQSNLLISEKGHDSDVIGVALEGRDPLQISQVLNAIGTEYVRQNIRRTVEEAEKSIAFLGQQLPELKSQLEVSESRYNQFRAAHGTVDLNAEASSLLARSAQAKGVVADLEQRRTQLLERFTPQHPAVRSIEDQLAEARRQVASLDTDTRKLPPLEQGLLRLQRDVQVSTDLYTNLLNTQEQLRLLKAGKVGNVRMLDPAVVPESPIRPKRIMAVLGGLLSGIFVGVALALLKRAVIDRVAAAQEIEFGTGLTVYAKVPRSKTQELLTRGVPAGGGGSLVLAHASADDAAIESLRSFHSALDFALMNAPNRIVQIAGPTPAVGKSFVSVNLAALVGASGQRVLLVDTDLRRGTLHVSLGADQGPGLAEIVMHNLGFEQVVRRAVLPGVDFISCGAYGENPSGILLHRNFQAFLRRVEAEYDLVLIDSPPILPVADSGIVAKLSGTVFMVVRHGLSSLEDIRESARRLAQLGVPIHGVIFNDMSQHTRYGRDYGTYRYGTSANQPKLTDGGSAL
ncbi:MAG: sugar transporter [Paraburkholderia sp.]|uniref:GNVR domain-containing protein n=1 Tax=Paraburkholderia sp. TaxID=1926495 RepID=UPI001203CCAF|nr:GNVR domain-containing protein [Paraburkholderia sp.]TAM06243.1 MAG: sugar transporter [Paraburkholderia sp.]TAM31936.1 MAG: sugar transporter [Paraburkholderia sp.]